MHGFYIYYLFVWSCIFKAFARIFFNMPVLCHSVSFMHSDVKTRNLILYISFEYPHKHLSAPYLSF